MNIRIQISSHAVNVSRSWYPRAHGCAPFGTLNLGDSMVLFHATGEIDAVIAELVALRAEMDGPPAINGDRVKCLDKHETAWRTDYCQRDKGHGGQHTGTMGTRWTPPAVSGDYFFSSPDDSNGAEEVAEP